MPPGIAVVGAGYWGQNLVRNFAELGALYAICDTDSGRFAPLKASYPQAVVEADYRRLLADPQVSGMVIAVPAALHYAVARACLLAGKHIFVEKPLALRLEEGKELVDLAEREGRILMVGHVLEYHPAIIRLKELVDRGELGQIRYIHSTRLNFGKLRTEEDVLWSFAPHDISVILLLAGESPRKVGAEGAGFLDKNICDVVSATLSFSGGVKAFILVSWLNPYKEQKLIVVGDQATAVFDDVPKENKLTIWRHRVAWIGNQPVAQPGKPEVIPVPVAEPLKNECREFLECLQVGRKPRTDGRKGVQVLEVLTACQESLKRR